MFLKIEYDSTIKKTKLGPELKDFAAMTQYISSVTKLQPEKFNLFWKEGANKEMILSDPATFANALSQTQQQKSQFFWLVVKPKDGKMIESADKFINMSVDSSTIISSSIPAEKQSQIVEKVPEAPKVEPQQLIQPPNPVEKLEAKPKPNDIDETSNVSKPAEKKVEEKKFPTPLLSSQVSKKKIDTQDWMEVGDKQEEMNLKKKSQPEKVKEETKVDNKSSDEEKQENKKAKEEKKKEKKEKQMLKEEKEEMKRLKEEKKRKEEEAKQEEKKKEKEEKKSKKKELKALEKKLIHEKVSKLEERLVSLEEASFNQSMRVDAEYNYNFPKILPTNDIYCTKCKKKINGAAVVCCICQNDIQCSTCGMNSFEVSDKHPQLLLPSFPPSQEYFSSLCANLNKLFAEEKPQKSEVTQTPQVPAKIEVKEAQPKNEKVEVKQAAPKTESILTPSTSSIKVETNPTQPAKVDYFKLPDQPKYFDINESIRRAEMKTKREILEFMAPPRTDKKHIEDFLNKAVDMSIEDFLAAAQIEFEN